MGIELNNDQIFANYDLCRWWKVQNKQTFEISGGAGTGKTTCILYFIQQIGLPLDKVLFVSYMGKAVAQMIRNGLPAKTIHATCYNYHKEVMRDENGCMIFDENNKQVAYIRLRSWTLFVYCPECFDVCIYTETMNNRDNFGSEEERNN